MSEPRSKTSPSDMWDLKSLYHKKEDWENELNSLITKAKGGFEELNAFKGKVGQGDPKTVKKLLEIYFDYGRQLEKLYTFSHLKHDEDIGNDENKSSFDRSVALYHAFSNQTSWVEPEIVQLDEESLKTLINHDELKDYKFYLQTLFDQKEHVLDKKQEELLSLASKAQETPRRAFSGLSNVDMKFADIEDSEGKKHKLTLGSYGKYMKSYDRTLRENAFIQTHATFAKYENTLTALLAGQLENHVFRAKARGYKSCLEAAIKQYQIPTTVVTNLIESTRKGVGALHRYVSLRKKLLGYEKLNFWDLSVPMVKDVEMKFPYDQACDMAVDSIGILGKEYQEILRNGLTRDAWVDRYENQGKRSGAYSSGCYDSVPYILLNYQGMLNDFMTLVHEGGHSMHSYYSNRNQAYHEANYPIFVAEVASTFNEQIASEYLIERAKTKEERLYLLNHEIDSIRGTFFRQTMFAEFELKIHELAEQDQPLTKDVLKKIYLDLNRDYFGPDLELCDELSVEFMRVPHFYYNFYVYQYATGISAAAALVDSVKKNGNEAYLNFLKSGGSDYPISILNRAGVDMTSSEAVESLIARFDDLVTKFEKEIV